MTKYIYIYSFVSVNRVARIDSCESHTDSCCESSGHLLFVPKSLHAQTFFGEFFFRSYTHINYTKKSPGIILRNRVCNRVRFFFLCVSSLWCSNLRLQPVSPASSVVTEVPLCHEALPHPSGSPGQAEF